MSVHRDLPYRGHRGVEDLSRVVGSDAVNEPDRLFTSAYRFAFPEQSTTHSDTCTVLPVRFRYEKVLTVPALGRTRIPATAFTYFPVPLLGV